MISSRSYPVSIIFGLGLAFLYVGERITETGNNRAILSGLGALVVLFAIGLRLTRMRGVSADRAAVERAFLLLQLTGVAALFLYFVQSDLWAKVATATLDTTSPKLAGVLAALWPALLAIAVLPQVLMEFAYAAMARAKLVELGRMREATWSGLGLAFAFVFAMAGYYVASERDGRVDLSYFRTTKPGDATRKLVASLDEPVKVALFFPKANDVAEEVKSYFEDLKAESKLLEVEELDHPLEPVKARELGVSGNGTIVVSKGSRKESMVIGTDIEKARSALRGLDQDVQKRLLLVARGKRVIYLTQGHGERREEPIGSIDQRATISALRNKLREQNYELKNLSTAEGLGAEVPKDAAAVLILGPTQPFSEPEAKTLEEYGKRGGKLLIALDPEAGLDFKELVQPLGLKFDPTMLANDAVFIRSQGGPSDRSILATSSFSSHPVAGTVGRAGSPTVFLTSGSVDELPAHPAELTVDFTVRANAQTFNDLNNNFNADPPGETRKSYGLVASVTRRAPSNKLEEELRVVVMADSDAVGDIVLPQVQTNQALVLDTLKWLFGEERTMGLTNSETDVAIVRTRQQDQVWFYLTIFLAPAAVLLVGFFARRKKPKVNPQLQTRKEVRT
ncbi:MAG: Gldg family protein [Myxococcaceae bacterium]|nr:Gldg family protein [Myxococcaceae bacterium]